MAPTMSPGSAAKPSCTGRDGAGWGNNDLRAAPAALGGARRSRTDLGATQPAQMRQRPENAGQNTAHAHRHVAAAAGCGQAPQGAGAVLGPVHHKVVADAVDGEAAVKGDGRTATQLQGAAGLGGGERPRRRRHRRQGGYDQARRRHGGARHRSWRTVRDSKAARRELSKEAAARGAASGVRLAATAFARRRSCDAKRAERGAHSRRAAPADVSCM